MGTTEDKESPRFLGAVPDSFVGTGGGARVYTASTAAEAAANAADALGGARVSSASTDGGASTRGNDGATMDREQLRRRLAAVELENYRRDPQLFMRHIATRLVEHGRELGRTETARLAREQVKRRISSILDQAVTAFPCVEPSMGTLEQWRDGRRLLMSALGEWHGEPQSLPPPPFPREAQLLLEQALKLVTPPPPEGRLARARRHFGIYANIGADFLEAVNEVLQRKARERKAERIYLGDDGEQPEI